MRLLFWDMHASAAGFSLLALTRIFADAVNDKFRSEDEKQAKSLDGFTCHEEPRDVDKEKAVHSPKSQNPERLQKERATNRKKKQ